MKRPTNLRAKIRIIGTGKMIEGTPEGFGMRGNDGKMYNRSEYQVIKRYTVDNKPALNKSA